MCAGKKAYGCYSWGSNILRIDEKLVKDFEAGKGLVTMKNGKKVYLVGVTIPHELTHWADAQDVSMTPCRAIRRTRKAKLTRKGYTAKSWAEGKRLFDGKGWRE